MDNNENKYLVGLDIGTTKIVCIAAQKIENGKLRILGVGKSESKGIVHGEVLNLNLAVKSIQEAVSLCKKSCTNMQLDIHEVYVGIAGSHIKTDETYELLKRENPEEPITEDDLKILEERVNKTDIGVNNQIITVISEGYNIDSQHYVTNDNILGCTGKQIDAKFHIISGNKTQIKLMNTAVERSGLKIKELFLQPIASKYAVTTPVDDEAGVAVLDIGGGTSDLAIFADKQFKHTSIIPFGGENITEDIRALGMIKSQAEKLKIDFGTAIPTEVQKNRFIAIPTLNGLKGIEINQYQLATVINRKMIEILEFINKKLADLQLYDKLSYGIIITGGGAILKDMKQLVEFKLGLNCRIGLPNLWVSCENNQELEKEIQKPLYATCVGLILLGFKTLYDNNISIVDNNQETTKQQNTLNITSVDPLPIINTAPLTQETILENEFVQNEPVIDKKPNDIKKRVGFLDGLKTSLIDLFSEEKDKNI